jgi:DNA-binding transcriptional regulator YdaS (Cro superfamily)
VPFSDGKTTIVIKQTTNVLTNRKQLFYSLGMNTPLEKAAELAGGQTKLAIELTKLTTKPVTQAHVWNWINRSNGVAPPEFCSAIEQIVGKKVTRQELRPNDWKQIWPELNKEAA